MSFDRQTAIDEISNKYEDHTPTENQVARYNTIAMSSCVSGYHKECGWCDCICHDRAIDIIRKEKPKMLKWILLGGGTLVWVVLMGLFIKDFF
jgi:hypothetical protein